MCAEIAMPKGPIGGTAAWTAADLVRSQAWMHRLDAGDVAEIERAVVRVEERGLDPARIGRADFPLPGLAEKLDRLLEDVVRGRGVALVQGLPVERWPRARAARAFLGIGAHLGRALPQNRDGHLLGHVRDVGADPGDPGSRLYQTRATQKFHSDSCDVVGLLCLAPSKAGGVSRVVSSVAAYDEMLRQRPELAAKLFRPLATDRRGEVPAGAQPYYSIPVFNWHAGLLSTVYNREYIDSALRFPSAPRLGRRQVEALDLFDAVCEDASLSYGMDLAPGDIQLLHNHQVLHGRTGFEDWPEPGQKRHLLRLWLCPPSGRPLPPCFAERYGGVEIGNRGGIVVPGATPHAPLDPEATG